MNAAGATAVPITPGTFGPMAAISDVHGGHEHAELRRRAERR